MGRLLLAVFLWTTTALATPALAAPEDGTPQADTPQDDTPQDDVPDAPAQEVDPSTPVLPAIVRLDPSLIVEEPAPAVLGVDLAGDEVSIEVEAVSLTWSIDCMSCRSGLKTLVRLQEMGIKVVAINTDPASSSSKVKHYLKTRDLESLTVVQTKLLNVPDNTPLLLATNGDSVTHRVMNRLPKSKKPKK